MSEADRRKHPRIAVLDSHGTVDGEVYTLENWSREGALITGASVSPS